MVKKGKQTPTRVLGLKNPGPPIECIVPTHSLINYAQWRIVSPESHLIDIPALDGYIAQVWTGTARSANIYKGVERERTFETAYLEYGQMLGMVRPTGKKVWFLADPVEDNPNRSWNDYKRNYECTVVASLMWPEVHRYEVMPWPDRIFQGTYPAVDMDAKSGKREGIPPEYATEILIMINALNEMNQPEVSYGTGTRSIGMIVSDTLMFQRAAPEPSELHLGTVYGLALPLVKNGVPVEVVQLENSVHPKCLAPYKVLLLTYEGQKPLKPEYHEAIERWVRNGGGLIYCGDGKDPYAHVREWWNDQGKNGAKPADDLFKRLGITDQASNAPQAVDKGFVRVFNESPADLQQEADGSKKVMALVAEMLGALGGKLEMQNYLRIQRGPFVVAAVLDESVSDAPLVLKGRFVDLLNPSLPVISEKALQPNERGLLYDLDWLKKSGITTKVVAAGARVKQEEAKRHSFTCVFRGPKATRCNARIYLPKAPAKVSRTPEGPVEQQWDLASSTLWVSFENSAEDVTVDIGFE